MENINNNSEKIRFTTLVNPNSLTKIKLISYFTNCTFSNIVDESLDQFIKQFEKTNKISIDDLMSLKDKFNIDPINNIDNNTNIESINKVNLK
jgi:hypothetical protein